MSVTDKLRKELLEEFRNTAKERSEKISLRWIELESNPDQAGLADDLMRQLHSLKGESKMMGFSDISLIAHKTEELVLASKQKGFSKNPELGDLVLAASDAIVRLVQKRAGGHNSTFDLTALVERFEAVLSTENEQDIGPEPKPKARAQSHRKTMRDVPPRSIPQDSYIRVKNDIVQHISDTASELVIAHARHERTLQSLRQGYQKVIELTHNLQQIEEELATQDAWSSHDSLRAFHNNQFMAFELRRAQTQMEATLEDHAQDLYEADLMARDLEYHARRLRLVPIHDLLKVYARTVRDLAQEQGKLASCIIDDPGVTIDKSIADRLPEPLLHIVRNSIDHGLELPDEREAAGKTCEGTIRIQVRQDGHHAYIIIDDDGRGIDPNFVAQRAKERGLLNENNESPLTSEQILNFLFQPGFSTRDSVNAMSGRGVGLDVVKCQIESLGGELFLHSDLGRGTRFELRIPLTVSLTRVLVIDYEQALFAIPASSILGVADISNDDVETLHNQRVIRFQNETIPLTEFSTIFSHSPGALYMGGGS